MPRVSFYTFAVGKGALDSEVMSGFVAMIPSVFGEAEGSGGFLGRAVLPDRTRPPFGQDFGPWGVFGVPRFYDGGTEPGQVTVASTLSLWRDIEAVRCFAYGGLHKAALAKRGEWFRRPEWPTYVMWWVADEETPTWAEASRKLEALHDLGPTLSAFNFKIPFDPQGRQLRHASAAAGRVHGI
ncbi:DUF3291 domain-containing protein [Siccirubricoccus sp. KC 17139]|uniref:DUF3291 domain-containing protein n=1 Tax=Siccirubricoccus soli TaxID=2899147 RepID=A0ABT1D1U1_9PROT|nr:DUF3291 domain-containing protein [Siccirubricoccus soli]MCO6415857.1 DUF3291 domain-containing protein [Siccirubricoccus soli]MCP2681989.1 DUF3291 domain-containing protein [Siccirubricoccus soli]